MLLTCKNIQVQLTYQMAAVTLNPIFPTSQRSVHTHAKPRPMAQNGKQRLTHERDVATQTMASARIRCHLHAVDY